MDNFTEIASYVDLMTKKICQKVEKIRKKIIQTSKTFFLSNEKLKMFKLVQTICMFWEDSLSLTA